MEVVGLYLAQKEALNCKGPGFGRNQKRLRQSFAQLIMENVLIALYAIET